MSIHRMPMPAVAAPFLLALLATGCSENGGQSSRPRKVEGIANSINLETKVVSMTIKREDDSETDVSGVVTDNTQVVINGRVQSLKDVRKGEKVVAYVRKDKSAGESSDAKFIVERVEIERPSDADWKTAPPVTVATPEAPPAIATPRAASPPPASPPVAPTMSTEPATSTGLTRGQGEDLVYGQIRISMEQAILERADLLAAGKTSNDPHVSELERRILKARELLRERGEVLEDVSPPLPESVATPQSP